MRVTILLALLALPQFAAAQTANDALVAEVRTLSAATDNDARFDALTALLKAHNLPFTVETFTLDKPPAAGPNGCRRVVPDASVVRFSCAPSGCETPPQDVSARGHAATY